MAERLFHGLSGYFEAPKGLNSGENLLIELAMSLMDNKMPSNSTRETFIRAVRMMIQEKTRSHRAEIFIRAVGMVNPAHRPRDESSANKQLKSEIVKRYWQCRMLGFRKGQAAEEVAVQYQTSEASKDGWPSPKTVTNYVNTFPEIGRDFFQKYKMFFSSMSANLESQVEAEINKKLERKSRT